MSDYITLMGSEDVQRAGSRMSDAAETMQRAASSYDETTRRFLQQFEYLVERIEAAMADTTVDNKTEERHG